MAKTLSKGIRYDLAKLRFLRWTGGKQDSDYEGYDAWAYFEPDGTYRGRDEFGIEPLFEVVPNMPEGLRQCHNQRDRFTHPA